MKRSTYFSSRGSIFLTTEVIVVIVVAFVLLILLGGFVKTQYASIDETSSILQDEVISQIIDDLYSRGNRLVLFHTEYSLGLSEESVQWFGMQNVFDSPKYFHVRFQYQGGEGDFVDFQADEPLEHAAIFLWDDSWKKIEAGEHLIDSFAMTAADFEGRYLYKLQVDVADDAFGSSAQTYADTSFFVDVE